MKSTFTIALVLLSIGLWAQDAPQNLQSQDKRPHRLELRVSSGVITSGYPGGYPTKYYNSPKWIVNPSADYSAGLSVYVAKRVNVGLSIGVSQWNTIRKVTEDPALTIYPSGYQSELKLHNNVLSVMIVANYNQPIGRGYAYVGAAGGYATTNGNQYLANGHGRVVNGHVGYAYPFVKDRFWISAEAGASVFRILDVDNHYMTNPYYSMTNFPVLLGLKFRL